MVRGVRRGVTTTLARDVTRLSPKDSGSDRARRCPLTTSVAYPPSSLSARTKAPMTVMANADLNKGESQAKL